MADATPDQVDSNDNSSNPTVDKNKLRKERKEREKNEKKEKKEKKENKENKENNKEQTNDSQSSQVQGQTQAEVNQGEGESIPLDENNENNNIASGRRLPKLPKGTRDAKPHQMAIREKAFNIIKTVFQRHGAVGIDTPVFELKETLTGKYGEDSKLIYDLADQGGELLSLRYDLTVPFARYCAVNGVTNIKRYHIGKVYRRDNPAMNRGRFREFYQCDYDVAGVYPSMVPDADVLSVLSQVLNELKLGEYIIKLNHRKLLDALMQVAGVPAEKLRAICSAIDKLDKEPWDNVKKEMVVDKGLDEASADIIGSYVVNQTAPAGNPYDLLNKLKKDDKLSTDPQAIQAFEELELLFGYLESLGALSRISFDMSLARGLDYYTGVIYEAVLTDSTGGRVGSIAAGGRYDGLVGMFSGKQTPAVGVSIGIERVLSIMEELASTQGKGQLRESETQILVASQGKDKLTARMKIAKMFWDNGINAEFLYDLNPKPKPQMEFAMEQGISLVAWVGDSELATNTLTVKTVAQTKEQSTSVNLPMAEVVPYVKSQILLLNNNTNNNTNTNTTNNNNQ